jgi:hypothetical protein
VVDMALGLVALTQFHKEVLVSQVLVDQVVVE